MSFYRNYRDRNINSINIEVNNLYNIVNNLILRVNNLQNENYEIKRYCDYLNNSLK